MRSPVALTFLTCLVLIEISEEHLVRPTCDKDAEICNYELAIYEKYTMMWYVHKIGVMYPVFIDRDGMTMRMNRNCSEYHQVPPADADSIVFGDGSHKLSLLINGQLPGPPIIVYEGQQVAVNVTNEMLGEATTIHWHGILQRNSPWMDGVSSVSQCSIAPRETFTYRFIAEPVGTHWYHSHLGAQISMGIYGPLIVLPREGERQKLRGDDPLPEFAEEFYMMLQDFFREDSRTIMDKNKHDEVRLAGGFDIPSDKCFSSTKQSDGLDSGIYPFNSIIINGKGRHYVDDVVENPYIPLEVFKVEKGKKYRFRVVCANMMYALQVSIDGHPLNIIASDGHDLVAKQVDALIIYSGERYDFWIDAKDPDELGSYWIRIETLEKFHNGKPHKPGHSEAVLQYSFADPAVEPRSPKRVCTEDNKCVILSCPFEKFEDAENKICVPLTEMRSTAMKPTLGKNSGYAYQEHFLNVHFSFSDFLREDKGTINGLNHIHHTPPLQVYPDTSAVNTCDKMTYCDPGKEDLCGCTNLFHLPLKTVVQLVISTTLINRVGEMNGNPHPIHIHGHQVQLIKIGYSELNSTNQIHIGRNRDIVCDSIDNNCNKVTWTDSSWHNDNIPGIVERGAPYKDTMASPAAGYFVVRFFTDNPGFWYFHCHIEPHNEEGMAMVIQAGEVADMNPAPEHMQSCGNSRISSEEFLDRIRNPRSATLQTTKPDSDSAVAYQMVILGLSAFILILLAVVIFMYYQLRRYSGYTYVTGSMDT